MSWPFDGYSRSKETQQAYLDAIRNFTDNMLQKPKEEIIEYLKSIGAVSDDNDESV